MPSMESCVRVAILVSLLLLLPEIMSARHISRHHSHHGHHRPTMKLPPPNGSMKHKKAGTLQVAGSRLPDCSHACGSCSPCRLVMVSFVCANIEEAESCPMAYKCMCNNKSYPIP